MQTTHQCWHCCWTSVLWEVLHPCSSATASHLFCPYHCRRRWRRVWWSCRTSHSFIGITQLRFFLYAPFIRPSLHRTVTRRSVIPQSFAASFTVMVSPMLTPPSFSGIVYHCGRTKSIIFGIKSGVKSGFVLLCVILPIYDLNSTMTTQYPPVSWKIGTVLV